jgi:predicted unusual protein kinase regulating ubiquinone biosynthesis (AarF/ABC1/UbiB family)
MTMPDAARPRARYRRIMRFAAFYIAQAWWFELVLPRIGLRRFSARGRTARLRHIARRFHALAIELGGLMIKVGQFLSSRLDVLPPVITNELAGLQDEVPPAAIGPIRLLAEAELGVPLERAYAWFDEIPLAAASLGQVHRARLNPANARDAGFADVVVKVQRPGIERVVEVDLAALRRIAGWLSRVRVIRDHVDLPELVKEFAAASRHEIDYVHEATNAERFAANAADEAGVNVPEVAWERTTRRVLTLRDVGAIKISDLDALRAAGIDPAAVAAAFAETMFDQLFVHGFFHADPHPGNVFVTPGTAPPWTITFVDFGMMGEVSDTLRGGLRKLIIAVAARDGKGLVDGIREVGVLLPSADSAALERAMTELFARFGGMGFAELRRVDPGEFRDFAVEFGDVLRAMPFQLPQDFLLIIRAISLTSGVCSTLDPEFNIWAAVEPYAGKLMRDEATGVVRELLRRAATTVQITASLPGRLDALAARMESGQLAVEAPRLERRLRRVERGQRRIVAAVVFAGLFVGGAVLDQTVAVAGVVLMVASAVPLLYALFASVIRPRGPH